MIPLLHPGTGDGASHPYKVGDLVHNGNGTTLWRITGFWANGATLFAELERPDRAWVRASATIERLRAVES